MLAWLSKLFAGRTIELIDRLSFAQKQTIEAQQLTINELKNEIEYLRQERREIQTLLNRALRLEPQLRISEGETVSRSEPSTKSWPKMKAELERKHRGQISPEDARAKYWADKAREMEATVLPATEAGDATQIETELHAS